MSSVAAEADWRKVHLNCSVLICKYNKFIERHYCPSSQVQGFYVRAEVNLKAIFLLYRQVGWSEEWREEET